VTEVVAVEPEPRLRRIAQAEAADLSLNIRVRDSVASQLPLEDDSCDVGVASLVLCSVPAQGEALQELRRVIRPGGEPRFYEHVASPNRRLAHAQRLIDRLFWPKIGGGCHCARDTLAAIERAGFSIETLRRFRFKPSPLIGLWTSLHVLGTARRTSGDPR
jgi:ubiquinone/menaquinone biosynthesis C-methylase UbiE